MALQVYSHGISVLRGMLLRHAMSSLVALGSLARQLTTLQQHVNMMERLQRHVMVSSEGVQSLSSRPLPFLGACIGRRTRERERERERASERASE